MKYCRSTYIWEVFALVLITNTVTVSAAFRTVSVVIGGTAKLPCRVGIQGNIAVLWQGPKGTTLASNSEVRSQDSRLSVRRPSGRKWILQIRDVAATDRGNYTCHIATRPVTTKTVLLDIHYPPEITAYSPDVMVGLGQNATMSCDAVGVPSPTVTWYKYADGDEEGVFVATGRALLFSDVTQEESGRYKCIARNEILPDASVVISLAVQAPPIVSGVNSVVSQSLGDDAVLNCLVTAYPAAQTHWHRARGAQLVETPGGKYREWQRRVDDRHQMAQVFIKQVERDDFGAYVCTAENEFGRSNVTVKLTELKVHGSRIVKPPSNVITPLGRRVVLTCLVEGTTHHDNVIWWRHLVNGSENERIFESNPSADTNDGGVATVSTRVVKERYEVVGHYSLAVRNVQWEDSGNYTCELQGRKQRTAKLTAVASPICQIANNNQTTIIANNNNNNNMSDTAAATTLRVGQRVHLQCHLVFSQQVADRWRWHVDWERDDGIVGASRRLASLHDDGPMVIRRRLRFVATPMDAGRYTCVVRHRQLNYTASCHVAMNVVLTDDEDDTDGDVKTSSQNSTSATDTTTLKSSSFLGMTSLSLILVAVCCGLFFIFCAVVICVVLHYRNKMDKQRQQPTNRRYGNGAMAMERDSLMGQRRSNEQEAQL